jgi:hypothetical protein
VRCISFHTDVKEEVGHSSSDLNLPGRRLPQISWCQSVEGHSVMGGTWLHGSVTVQWHRLLDTVRQDHRRILSRVEITLIINHSIIFFNVLVADPKHKATWLNSGFCNLQYQIQDTDTRFRHGGLARKGNFVTSFDNDTDTWRLEMFNTVSLSKFVK